MKKIYLLAAVAAVLCGLFTFLYLSQGNSGGPKVEVVVANQDIPAYTKITEDMVEVVSLSKDGAHEDCAKTTDDVVGKLSSNSFAEDQQILVSQLGTENNVGSSLSYQIAKGKEAITIYVDTAPGVGGYITDDDYIDLLRKETTQGESKSAWTGKVIEVVKNAHVLKAGTASSSSEDGGGYSYLTLELTPEQCRKVYGVTANSDNTTNSIFYAVLHARNDK